uniref:Uncharacterized protein n=1 Tax=Ixodes ricinus TaxID=34613 RepID=A0A6B0U2Y6_IXORI
MYKTQRKKEKGNPGHCSNILLYTTRSYRKKKTLKTLITKIQNKIIFCTECILQSSTLPHIPHFILRHPPKKTQKTQEKKTSSRFWQYTSGTLT